MTISDIIRCMQERINLRRRQLEQEALERQRAVEKHSSEKLLAEQKVKDDEKAQLALEHAMLLELARSEAVVGVMREIFQYYTEAHLSTANLLRKLSGSIARPSFHLYYELLPHQVKVSTVFKCTSKYKSLKEWMLSKSDPRGAERRYDEGTITITIINQNNQPKLSLTYYSEQNSAADASWVDSRTEVFETVEEFSAWFADFEAEFPGRLAFNSY